MLPLTGFSSFIEKNQLCLPGDKILLAVSGGKDSVLMTHLFNGAGFSTGIAHCNFGLRGPDSDADEEFVRSLATGFALPFHVQHFATGEEASARKISVQMAARDLRYAWLEDLRKSEGYDYIAVAHHLGDATETILLNLTRGTGIQGMHGILPKRAVLIRPLLFLDRPEIDAIVAKNALPFREDQSNATDKYARNRMRHQVIPALKLINPSLDQTFAANSRRFAEAEEFIALAVAALRKTIFTAERDTLVADPTALKALHPRNLLLFELFRPFHFTAEVLGDLVRSFDKPPGRIFRSSTHQVTLDRQKIILEKRIAAPALTTVILANDRNIWWNHRQFEQTQESAIGSAIPQDPGTAWLDAGKLEYPLTVRSWKKGDFFFPLGMNGKKKISDFFTSLKIPVSEKQRIPIFENGNGDIVWVAGYRINEHYKVSSLTKKVIIFESNE